MRLKSKIYLRAIRLLFALELWNEKGAPLEEMGEDNAQLLDCVARAIVMAKRKTREG